jgi:hypothetical protein
MNTAADMTTLYFSEMLYAVSFWYILIDTNIFQLLWNVCMFILYL